MPEVIQSQTGAATQADTKSTVLQFYGLREQAFGVTPNPRFFYASVGHREALAALICGVDNEVGFASLISAPGLGKTTLLFDLLNQRHDTTETAFIFNTLCSGKELVRQIANELHIESDGNDPLRLQADLRQFLADAKRTRPVLIIIDEAQNLDHSALETVRLLSDFETPDRKLLHIVLAGQPELAQKLQRPSLSQLLQRITIVSRLEPLQPAEIGEYVKHRLRVAGSLRANAFSERAISSIGALSRGIPREINRICFNAMLLGCASGRHVIEPELIDEVARDLEFGRDSSPAVQNASHSTAVPGSEHHRVNGISRKPSDAAPGPSPVPFQPQASAPTPAQPRQRPPQASRQQNAQTVAFPPRPRLHAPDRAFGSRPPQPLPRVTVAKAPSPGRKPNAPLLGALVVLLGFAGWTGMNLLKPPQTPDSSAANSGAASASGSQSEAADAGVSSTATPVNAATAGKRKNNFSTGANSRATSPSRGNAVPPNGASAVDDNATGPTVMEPSAVPLARPTQPAVPAPQLADSGIQPADSSLKSLVGDMGGASHRAVLSAPPVRSESAIPPMKVSGANPVYPAAARMIGLSGDVVLTVGISKEGDVRSVHVMSGNPAFVQAAVDAVRRWKYRPSYVNGHTQPADMKITVHFSLSER